MRMRALLAVLMALLVVAVFVWYRFPPPSSGRGAAPALAVPASALPPATAPLPGGAADRAVPGLSGTYRLDYTRIPLRHVGRADFAVSILVQTLPTVSPAREWGWLIVHDPSSNQLARYGVPHGSDSYPINFHGLTDHGRQALFAVEGGHDSSRRLALLTLSSGRFRWFDSDPATDGAGVLASASPDGTQIATVQLVNDPSDPNGESEDLSRVAVGVVDVATGAYRQLWLSPENAGWGDGSGIAWSPDQRLLAATYVSAGGQTIESMFATIVVGVDGHIQPALPLDTIIVPIANSAWLRSNELVTATEDGSSASAVVNTSTGARHTIHADQVIARSGNWYVQRGTGSGQLMLRPINGGTPRAWLTVVGRIQIDYVGFAQ